MMRARLLFFGLNRISVSLSNFSFVAILVLNVAVLEAVICFRVGDYCPGGKLYQNRLQYTGFTLSLKFAWALHISYARASMDNRN